LADSSFAKDGKLSASLFSDVTSCFAAARHLPEKFRLIDMKDSVEQNYKSITVIILQQDAAIHVIPPFRQPFEFVFQSGN
jgi:hypothetical protein|tara:strand:+ start:66 stop:305 length:240 start_codon:yes stop_codon:yes gene_type:complete